MQTVPDVSMITLDDLPEAYIRFDSEFRCTFVNQAAQILLGNNRAKFLGKRLWDVFPESAGTSIEEGLRRAMAENTVFTFDLYEKLRNRHYATTAIHDSSDGILLRFSEITESESIEPERQESNSQSRLHGIARNLPGFVYQNYVRDNGEWGVYFADKRAADIFGIDPEPLETVFRRFAERIAPEDQERYITSIRESTRLKKDWEFEGRFIKPTGETRYIQCVSRPRRLGNETVYDGIIIDITDQRRSEQALRESEKLYHRLFEVESDAIVLVDNESGQILATNAAATNLYGYSREELLAMNRSDLSSEPDKTLRATTQMQTFIPLRWHRKKDRTVFPVEISGSYFDLKGRSVFVSAIRDITDRRVMEEALKKSEEKFSRAFQSNPAALTITDLATSSYLEVNGAFEQITGYRRDEVIGRSWDELGLWTDPSNREEAARRLLTDKYLRNWEFSFRKKNGDVGSGLLSADLIEIEGNQCAITATVDITERLQLESQFRQAQKLESLGRLAGGIAHDFNNILTVINGYSDLMLKSVDPHGSLHSQASEINKAGERAAGLTSQLLAFSRKQVIEARSLNVNTIISDTERMLRRLIGEDIEFVTELDPLVGQIMADPGQIHQVIMNLVVNARDAMPNGGKLKITTNNVDVDESAAALHGGRVPGKYVLMTVTDTGIGMDEKTLQSAFEPFFTTKEHGQGTGLGLSTVHGIVQQSGGWIRVWSTVGQGTSFDIYLPRIDACLLPDREPSATTEIPHDGETVLVVEDQGEVRRLTRTILESYGYQVLEAANGAEALCFAEKHSGEIHLLLTDVILPGMNGRTLSEHLRVLRPNLKVIFTSGYPADVISRRGVLEQDVAYLPKPFSPESLAVKVREVLTGRYASRQSGGFHM